MSAELKPCPLCQGNGEVVVDWDRYMEPWDGDNGGEAVGECPDCGGVGTRASDPRGVAGISTTDKQRDDLLSEAWPLIYKTRMGRAHKLRVVDLENWLNTARALGFETGGV